jgi:hypothetical protein
MAGNCHDINFLRYYYLKFLYCNDRMVVKNLCVMEYLSLSVPLVACHSPQQRNNTPLCSQLLGAKVTDAVATCLDLRGNPVGIESGSCQGYQWRYAAKENIYGRVGDRWRTVKNTANPYACNI